MKLWIARDFDGGLYTFRHKPWLQTVDKIWLDFPIYIDWKDNSSYYEQLDCNLYPEITFKNSPQQVELKSVKKEKNMRVYLNEGSYCDTPTISVSVYIGNEEICTSDPIDL